MRDERFKAEHRGGPLNLLNHRLLATWAADCAEHVLLLFDDAHPNDNRPRIAIKKARSWARGEISVGEAREASISAHKAAKKSNNLAAQFAARSAGHAAATAHMADHAPRSAMYAIKAIIDPNNKENEVRSVEQEQKWQRDQLPDEIRDLVLSTLDIK